MLSWVGYERLPYRFATELGIPIIGDCLGRIKHLDLAERHWALSGLATGWVPTATRQTAYSDNSL